MKDQVAVFRSVALHLGFIALAIAAMAWGYYLVLAFAIFILVMIP